MDGYRNCALRKGTCLCQKLTDDPGVWTTMAQSVCTGHLTRANEPDNLPAASSSTEQSTVSVASTQTADIQPAGTASEATETTPPAAKSEDSSTFFDSITKVLTPAN